MWTGAFRIERGDVMQDHRSVALDAACMWAAYAQENGKVVTADEIVAAARQFAAFLTEPTTVRLDDQPTTTPTMRTAARKRT